MKFEYKPLWKEILLAVVIALSCYALFIIYDFMELWIEITRKYEKYEVDELLGLLLGAALGLLYFSSKLISHYKKDSCRIHSLSEQLDYQVNYDALTNLPNRNAFKRFTLDLIEDAQKTDLKFTVFFLDIDNFKFINDMLSYAVGDKLLQEVAHRLQSTIDSSASLSRVGSDEFCIILPGYTDDTECLNICTKLNDVISQTFNIDEHKLNVTQTIGISRFPEDGQSYEKLLRIANIAMYMGKKSGQAHSNFKDGNFIADMKTRFIVQHGLSEALIKKQFYMVYQPKINLQTGELVGAESLIRWEHPVHGLINPDDFINVAEETHNMHLIDLYVLEAACQQIQQWGENAKPIAVNVSPVLFADECFAPQVFHILKMYSVPHHLIQLEITERTIVADSQIPLLICQRFHEAGIKISLDDFGTGYSSLSHIARFPISELKIDRSFVAELCDNHKTKSIVTAIIELAKALNIDIVAEGIEDNRQYELTQKLGCTHAQGYYIDKPLSAADYTEKLMTQTAVV